MEYVVFAFFFHLLSACKYGQDLVDVLEISFMEYKLICTVEVWLLR